MLRISTDSKLILIAILTQIICQFMSNMYIFVLINVLELPLQVKKLIFLINKLFILKS